MPMSAFSGNVHRAKKSPSFFCLQIVFTRDVVAAKKKKISISHFEGYQAWSL